MNPTRQSHDFTMANFPAFADPRRGRIWIPFACLLLWAGFAASAAESVIRETALEFQTVADVDGDGLGDAVVVDRLSGNYRVGYQQAAGGFVWSGVRSSGLAQEITGFSAGNVLDPARAALVFTAPTANRVQVVDAGNRTQAGLPQTVHPGGIGPAYVAALDLPALGAVPLADLFVGSGLNADPYRIATVRANVGGLTPAGDVAGPGPLSHGNALALKTGGAAFAIALETGVTNRSLLAFNFPAAAPGLEFAERGLPRDLEYVTGRFRGMALAEFLFWRPGNSNVTHRPVLEPAPGTFQLGAATVFNLGFAIGDVVVLPGPTGTRLWVAAGENPSVRVFTFNGVAAPTLVDTLTPPAGESFTGALALGNGNFLGLTANGTSATTTTARVWSLAAGKYVVSPPARLPSLEQFAATGNVLFFNGDPLVNEAAVYLGAANARDWTSRPLFGPPTSVQAETFRGTLNGLGDAAPLNLGAAPLGTTTILPSQLTDSVSLFAQTAPSATAGASVTITPPGGTFATAIEVSLTAGVPGNDVFYRLDNLGAWARYTAPFRLGKTTTLSAYAQPPGGAMSAIRSAQFTVTTFQPDLDSDGDQVPDSVELARGLDPLNSGPDADGDGYSDLDELVNGSDPANATSTPAPGAVGLGPLGSFFTRSQPLPPNPATGQAAHAAIGTRLEAHALAGALLASGPIPGISPVGANVVRAGAPDRAASPVDSATLGPLTYDTRQPLYSLNTPVQFKITTTNINPVAGRELLAIALQPDLAAPDLPRAAFYPNANAWIIAASNVVHRFVRQGRQTTEEILSPETTLTALLFERKVGELLTRRGHAWASNLTLFPFRPADAGRSNATTELLWSLRQQADPANPGYDLAELLGGFRTLVGLRTNPGSILLRDVAQAIYLVNARSNDVAPGVFSPPVAALREFVATGVLASNYVSAAGIASNRLATAPAVLTALLAGAVPRELARLAVTFKGWENGFPRVSDASDDEYMLLDPQGKPFGLLDTFELLPGTRLIVTGYVGDAVRAVSEASYPGIEVVSVALTALPAETPADENANLLPDDWERRFLGSLNRTATFLDPDGDGYRTLQEMFAGSDPLNAASQPAAAPVVLDLPRMQVRVLPTDANLIEFTWEWPAEFADQVSFGLRGGGDVGVEFAEIAATASRVGNVWRVTVPREDVPRRFFRLAVQLR
jgi:hypothetical protein